MRISYEVWLSQVIDEAEELGLRDLIKEPDLRKYFAGRGDEPKNMFDELDTPKEYARFVCEEHLQYGPDGE